VQRLGVKERLKYKDISWLMPSVDVEDVLRRLNVQVTEVRGDEVWAFCPDHHLFTGREPSHAKWSVNIKTGQTNCFTEGRGSNLVWTVCRLLDEPPDKVVQFLTGIEGAVDIAKLELKRDLHLYRKLAPSVFGEMKQPEEKPGAKGLSSIQHDISNRFMSERAYQFFIHPPEKKPTNIRRETVDHFMVFERTWGSWSNRVVIPFFMRGELVGCSAIDVLGITDWLKRHPSKTADHYKKTLYPLDFQAGECLFGFDECEKRADVLILVEGPRERMKLWQEGFPNTVAILGSYLSDAQYDLIAELSPKNVALMFDGDMAGRTTTDKVAEVLRVYRDRIIRCSTPLGRDPKNLEAADFQRLLRK